MLSYLAIPRTQCKRRFKVNGRAIQPQHDLVEAMRRIYHCFAGIDIAHLE
jgi:hypothetical protein